VISYVTSGMNRLVMLGLAGGVASAPKKTIMHLEGCRGVRIDVDLGRAGPSVA
jgi:hypothetical protein